MKFIALILCLVCLGGCGDTEAFRKIKYGMYMQGFFDGTAFDGKEISERTADEWVKLLSKTRENALKYSGLK